ncbi:MAG: 2Fe-2S iron-sulfur cluster-binding protein [Myxococcales bacterium]|nr:2Fe-2S iron-sulfur cluster-binding protein [Myxococcales bacterium]MDH5565685.1 2Fe-2S iron-sulfur cluster-binding protein [Myxococcales bacterium]
MPRITVDGVELEVPAGRTILQALDDAGLLMNGVDIPHYCWHPKLSIDGSCRLCQVEVEGAPKLQIACNTPVQDGMVIRTASEQVRTAREGVMELLLVNHPLDCPICDQAGECKLQDYAFEYGVTQSRTREPRRALKKHVALGPTIVFDQERCILCRRCVRFCREIPQTGELAVIGRGDRSVIETFPGAPLENDYSMNVADICPVGALTTRDFRFKIRSWFLQDVPGVCTGCARGCNISLSVANNKVYRYLPRRNDAVNDTWICDAGRDSYREIGARDRLKHASVRGENGVLETVSTDFAIQEAARRLARIAAAKGAGVIAGIASPHATNEDLFTFRRLLEALGAETRGVAVVRGASDALLVVEEKAANAAGARAIGFGDAAAVLDRLRSGAVDALIALGHDIAHEQFLGGTQGLEKLDTVVVLDSHVSELQRVAHVLVPTRVAAEKHGTLTNCAGRVQRVRAAVEPAWEAHGEGEILARLGAALGLGGFDGRFDVREVGKALSASLPAFEGIDLETVGAAGRPLATAGASG